MLDHAREILSFAQGRSLEDVENDRWLELSLLHLLALLGESAGCVIPRLVKTLERLVG